MSNSFTRAYRDASTRFDQDINNSFRGDMISLSIFLVGSFTSMGLIVALMTLDFSSPAFESVSGLITICTAIVVIAFVKLSGMFIIIISLKLRAARKSV